MPKIRGTHRNTHGYLMKSKFWIAPLTATMLALFSSSASAVVYDFIKLTQDNPGGLGESAWGVLNVGNMHITGHATQGTNPGQDNDGTQYAYLDWGRAGLGVCKDLLAGASTGADTGSGTNKCNPSSDDNVTNHEYLDFTFDQDVTVDKLYFNNNHDGGFDQGDKVSIGIAGMSPDPFAGLTAFDVALGYAPGSPYAQAGLNGIGPFLVAAGQTLRVAFKNEQFYISGIEVSAVPVPAAVWLFGTALAGLIGFGRRRHAAT